MGERNDIYSCDALLAYMPHASVGTAMGVMYAWFSHRTVAVWCPDGYELSKMLPFRTDAMCRSAGVCPSAIGGGLAPKKDALSTPLRAWFSTTATLRW